MKQQITPDQIETMLASLNQTYQSQFNGMPGAPQEAQKGLRGCLKWFQDNRISVCLVGGPGDPHYEIVTAPRNDVL